MINALLSALAFLLLIIGLMSMVTPIPGGTFLIAISISLLICSNAKVQTCMRYARTKSNRFNKVIFWLENKVGIKVKFIGAALENTRPLIVPKP